MNTNEHGDYIFTFQPDSICNTSYTWISASKNSAEIYIDEELVSKNNISIIESTPFLMLFMSILLQHNGLLLHSAGISVRDEGYIFCGKSGSGKTTVSNIFKFCELATVLSDETVVLRKYSDHVIIYGTPWKGSGDNIYNNASAVLKHLYFIFHGHENRSVEIKNSDAASILIKQAFPYFWGKRLMLSSFSLISSIINYIECSYLYFLPNASVVSYIIDS